MPFDLEWDAAMRRGDIATALGIADAVLAARDPATRDDPALPYHLRWVWDGSPVARRRVLVRCYHGLGDTLHFCRLLAPLRARAAHVTVELPASLLPLLGGLADHAVAFDPANPLPPDEVDVELMELGHVLRVDVADLPPPTLAAEPLGHGGIGLCWRAGAWDHLRSVPLGALRSALPTVPFVSLQRGPAAAEAAGGFVNAQDDDPDIGRTARLIRGCRAVVTVDTMVAHLAGTLGAPTWLLLRHDCDWRWRAVDGRAAGYPTVRLLRQAAPGDWSGPLAALSRAFG